MHSDFNIKVSDIVSDPGFEKAVILPDILDIIKRKKEQLFNAELCEKLERLEL